VGVTFAVARCREDCLDVPTWGVWLFWIWFGGLCVALLVLLVLGVRNAARRRALKPTLTDVEYLQLHLADANQQVAALGVVAGAMGWPFAPFIAVGWGGYRLLVLLMRRRYKGAASTP